MQEGAAGRGGHIFLYMAHCHNLFYRTVIFFTVLEIESGHQIAVLKFKGR